MRSHGSGVKVTAARSNQGEDITSPPGKITNRSGQHPDGESGIVIGSPGQGSAGTVNQGHHVYSAIASGIASGKASGITSGLSGDSSMSVYIEKLKSERSNDGTAAGSLVKMTQRDGRIARKDASEKAQPFSPPIKIYLNETSLPASR